MKIAKNFDISDLNKQNTEKIIFFKESSKLS
jgi:hypothetical protein